MATTHSFHIPVMGLGFTAETPLKVSQYGIDSVIALADDMLLEKLRKFYCGKNDIEYEAITAQEHDYRAKRITAYLNLLHDLTGKQFEKFKKGSLQKLELLREYIDMLPQLSTLREEFNKMIAKSPSVEELGKWVDKHLSIGSIDVNIMTKLDKENYINHEKQPIEFNDAHAALRGYAHSDLTSSLVLSAGMNPMLYSYMAQFTDFHPDENGNIKKKIIIKVSDYRSALIQGKFLAKKGLWVSEYRIESGLNCGGHAFATDGFLLGPILAEFRDKRQELLQETHQVYSKSLPENDHYQAKDVLPMTISVQGGVGTAEEHQFLLEHYQVDAVGWGSPFLLVPEATTVDEVTLDRLTSAKEEDLYLSNISPLGVQFNNLRQSTKGEEKNVRVQADKPGAPCLKKHLSFDREYSESGLCTASYKYQAIKIKELDALALSPADYQERYNEITEKECICTGLGAANLIVNQIDNRVEGEGVTICPGPNIAYFSRIMSLKELVGHIYGRNNVIARTDRPNMFLNELQMYVDYLSSKLDECQRPPSKKQIQYLKKFIKNLNAGISYYTNLEANLDDKFNALKRNTLKALTEYQQALQQLNTEVESLSVA